MTRHNDAQQMSKGNQLRRRRLLHIQCKMSAGRSVVVNHSSNCLARWDGLRPCSPTVAAVNDRSRPVRDTRRTLTHDLSLPVVSVSYLAIQCHYLDALDTASKRPVISRYPPAFMTSARSMYSMHCRPKGCRRIPRWNSAINARGSLRA